MSQGTQDTPWTRYAPVQAWDEAVDVKGKVREPYARVYAEIDRMSGDDLYSRAEALASTYLAQGVTFDHAGEERPFPLDIVPRVVGADEWDIISPGVAQRVKTLEAFLADVYGSQHCVTDGIVPRRLIASSQYFYRSVAGIEPTNGVRVHISGIDLVRDQHGIWRVLEDNVRVPSGVSYVLSNRRAMSQMFPDMFGAMGVRPVLEYSQRLRSALAKAAPEDVDDPTIVVLTPGVYNSAYYEHSLLARTMGVELVEGRDLECHNGRVYMRTTAGRRRVDVIYRRVDDDYLDPVAFRSDSSLGAPGLINAARLGNVTIANAVGNGVADDKLIYTYMPDLTRYYLGEDPILPNVDTWRLEEADAREEVLDRLDELVVKPVDGAGGKGVLIGPKASKEELDTVRAQILEDPRGWIAQPVIQLSTVPTLTEDGLEPRHVDLRPFAINDGNDVWVLPGGLTRVALAKGQLIVNSSQGGGSKDTWVLGGVRHRGSMAPPPESRVEFSGVNAVPQAAHPDDYAAGQQQAQQQQQQVDEATEPGAQQGERRMLSRIAESLFWIGRYVERADNTARLLDVHLNVLLEDPWVDEPSANASLLSVMNCEFTAPVSRKDVLGALAFDAKLSSSIAGTLTAARENARRAREVISTEVWESLNHTRNQLPRWSSSARPHEYFVWVRERAAVVWGLSSATTSRDDAWHFMELGRSLERADMIARLLMTRHFEGTTGPNWTTLLRTCSAHEAYLRTVRALVTEERAAEFLLVDRLFPRSIAYSLAKAEETLGLIEGASNNKAMSDRARLALGRARTNLEYRDVNEILAHLPEQMREVQRACALASDLIRDRYFLPASTVLWSQEAL